MYFLLLQIIWNNMITSARKFTSFTSCHFVRSISIILKKIILSFSYRAEVYFPTKVPIRFILNLFHCSISLYVNRITIIFYQG